MILINFYIAVLKDDFKILILEQQKQHNKGSSILIMRSQQVNTCIEPNTAQTLLKKKKHIKKRFKPSKNDTTDVSSDTSTSENSSNLQEIQKQINSIKFVYQLIKKITSVIKFSKDSYLACLKLLKRLSFKCQQKYCILIATSIISIICKVHEYKVPSYKQFRNLTNSNFYSQEIIQTQANILLGIDFQVPLVNQFNGQSQIHNEIDVLDTYFLNI